MSITKSQLKQIVKECLVEILAEGMGSNVSSSINEVKRKQQASPQQVQSPNVHPSALLRQNAQRTKFQQQRSSVNPLIKEAIRRESGGDDLMASILADTAEKTLPTMIENDRSKYVPPSGGGTIERVVASNNPEDLFGSEAASKWANLAFMGLPDK